MDKKWVKAWMLMLAMAVPFVSRTETAVEPVVSADGAETIVVTAAPLPKYRVETTDSGMLVDLPPEQAPFVVDTLTEDFIRERNVSDLDQLLSLQPGITQGGKTMMARQAGTYNIRGFGGCEVMMGGVPLTAGVGSFLDPTLLEGVDIVKGPVGGAYGGQNSSSSGDTMGGSGTIVLRTKKPSFDEDFAEVGFRGSYSKASGSAMKFTGDVNVVDENGTVAVRAPLAYAWRKPGWAPSGAGSGQMVSAAPSISWRPTENVEMGLDLFYQYSDQPAFQGIRTLNGKPYPGLGWDSTFTRPEDRMRFQVFGGTFRLDGQVNDWFSLRTRASFLQAQNRYFYYGPNSNQLTSFPAAGSLSWVEPGGGDRLTRNWYVSQDAVFEFETGEVEHKLLAGVNLTLRENTGWSFFGWKRGAPAGTLPAITSSDTMQKKIGFNLQEVAEWKGLTALLGVRADWHDSVKHIHEWAVSPRLGLSYDVLDEGWLILFANVSQTQNPNFNLEKAPGVYLDSTWRALQKEAGIRVNPVESLWLTTSVFRIDQTKAPLQLADTYYTDEGKTYSQGVEFSASGNLTENWSAYLAYAYIDYYDKTKGVRFDRFPPHALSFWTSYKAPWFYDVVFGVGGRWRHSWEMTFRGGQLDAAYRDQAQVKSLMTFDASVEVPIGEKGSVGLALKNIFNSRGIESARNLQAFANDGRTLELSCRWRF